MEPRIQLIKVVGALPFRESLSEWPFRHLEAAECSEISICAIKVHLEVHTNELKNQECNRKKKSKNKESIAYSFSKKQQRRRHFSAPPPPLPKNQIKFHIYVK
jgi:hypothetical protein